MKNKYKICHISSAHPRTDIRIFQKECVALHNAGFDVSLLVADGLGYEEKSGIKIFDAGKTGNRFARFTTAFMKIYKKAKEIDADVFHFHDPELMLLGYLLKSNGKKVIYDIHEDVPKDIMINTGSRLRYSEVLQSIYIFSSKNYLSGNSICLSL